MSFLDPCVVDGCMLRGGGGGNAGGGGGRQAGGGGGNVGGGARNPGGGVRNAGGGGIHAVCSGNDESLSAEIAVASPFLCCGIIPADSSTTEAKSGAPAVAAGGCTLLNS